jgi:hypothetical protein
VTLAEVLTNTAISSARLYQENKVNLYLPANVSIPAAVTVFPGESFQAPQSWTERAHHKLIYFQQADKRQSLRGLGTAGNPFRIASRGLQTPAQTILKPAAN